VPYLVHFDDGGSGMRKHDEPLEPGDELDDGGGRYRVACRADAEPAGVRTRLGGADRAALARSTIRAESVAVQALRVRDVSRGGVDVLPLGREQHVAV
jgi:hypothetical protein